MKDWNCEMCDKTSLSCMETKVIWGEVHLCNITSKKSKQQSQVSLSTASQVFPGWTSAFSRLRFFFPNPHLPSPTGNTGEKFNDLSQATSWFSSRGERNEWNALMCRQTTALCVLETPDTWRNECPDNRVDCQDQSLAAHLGYTTWELY